MAGTIANNFRVLIAQGAVDFDANTFKAIAMKEGFIFNPATHDLYADVSASEQGTGYGYTAGGVTLTGVSVAQNDTDARADITWNNITWTASGGTVGPFRYVVLYNDTPTSPADPLVAWWDYGSALTLGIGDSFTADVNATNGFWSLT